MSSPPVNQSSVASNQPTSEHSQWSSAEQARGVIPTHNPFASTMAPATVSYLQQYPRVLIDDSPSSGSFNGLSDDEAVSPDEGDLNEGLESGLLDSPHSDANASEPSTVLPQESSVQQQNVAELDASSEPLTADIVWEEDTHGRWVLSYLNDRLQGFNLSTHRLPVIGDAQDVLHITSSDADSEIESQPPLPKGRGLLGN